MIRPIVIGNWKANKTVRESMEFMGRLSEKMKNFDFGGMDVVMVPSLLAMSSIKPCCEKMGIQIGAQNVDWHGEKSYCGGYPAGLIAEFGRYVFVGHSEQRRFYGDTEDRICARIKTALKESLIPVICIGEGEEEYRKGETLSCIGMQIEGMRKALEGKPKETVILYEPVWALGTGISPDAAYINEVFAFIRNRIETVWGEGWYKKARFVYAGSVTPYNAGEYMKQENIDGLAAGSGSLEADRFAEIIERAWEGFSI